MAQLFVRSLARLALEICRYTYSAGSGSAAEVPNKADSLAYINAHSSPLGKPIEITGSETSFACVVPYADRNVVSYMGTKTEFGFDKIKSLDKLIKGGHVLTMLVEATDIIQQFRASLEDWSQNGRAKPVPFQLEGKHIGKAAGVTLEGLVHDGFLSELRAVQDRIVKSLHENGGIGKPVLVTGHSQGAAEAALATRALAAAGFQVEATYAFAAPRTGNADFARSVTSTVHRIEFGDDIVPHLPPTLIKSALAEIVAGHPVLQISLAAALSVVKDVGYVGLGALCYGHPQEKKFHIAMSTADEQTLFVERLKLLPKTPSHWADHHHLVGTEAEEKAGQKGNYTILVSPDGWPVA